MLKIKQVEELQDELDSKLNIDSVLASTDLLTDPDWSGATDDFVPTQLAIKEFADNNFSSGSTVTIGLPDDGDYSDGYHDYWLPSTTIANAVDDINETLIDVSPVKAAFLTGLDLTGPVFFSGKLSNNLPALAQWVVDSVSPGDTITELVDSASSTMTNPNTGTTFYAGNKRDYPSTLIGSVYAWKASGSISFPGVATSVRNLVSGVGTTGIIEITDISLYNTVHVKANAQIVETALAEGYNQYKVSADNGADETNTFKIYYTGATFVSPSFSVAPSVSENSIVNKYLSGIIYYGAGSSFYLSYTVDDLYYPVYVTSNQTTADSDYFVTIPKNYGGIPNYNSQLVVVNELVTLAALNTSEQSIAQGSVTLYKPNKSNVTTAFSIGTKAINTMGSPSTTQLEYFQDEQTRYTSHLVQSWDSTNVFSNTEGQLEVQNGKLIDPRHSGNYPSYTDTTNYYRRYFTGRTVNIDKGTLNITKTVGIGEPTKWLNSGGGKFQASLWVQRTSGWTQYDLGLAIGLPVGNGGIGIRDEANSATGVIKWSLPFGEGYIKPSDIVIIDIKFENTIATDYLTELDMQWTW